ncbi:MULTISPECIES: hypothetical protein [unclassified Actinomyces]|uniref:hypothetical protein n=1 Tax=unclassified Actinomyces TaxID=2609248 RepID=UPI0011BE4F6A|nr:MULTISPECIES: hypothetical protein [unclassified Actinomyces]
MKCRAFTSLLLAGSLILGAAPAFSAVTMSTTGASATRSGNTVTVRDTSADSHSVFANVNNTGNRLDNNAGYGASVSRTYGFTVTSVRACVNIQRAPDRCSNWG